MPYSFRPVAHNHSGYPKVLFRSRDGVLSCASAHAFDQAAYPSRSQQAADNNEKESFSAA